MKKGILSIIALLIGGGVCAQTNSSFLLTGKVKNLKEGARVTLLTYKFAIKGEKVDTLGLTTVHDGKFQLKGAVSAPTYAKLLIYGNLPYHLFLENSKMELVGDSLKSANVTGSKSQTEYAAFNRMIRPLDEEMLAMAKTRPSKDELEQFQKRSAELVSKRKELARSFATNNPNSFVSPVVLLITAGGYFLDPLEAYRPVYTKFSNTIKNSYAGKAVKERLDNGGKVREGDMAPAITAKTPDGKDLSLAEVLKGGKLTLIDFWASWCGGCRVESEKVKVLYDQYHAMGFNVFGVSIDKNLEQWKKAIAEDRTNWNHVSDATSKIINAYGVKILPATFLVDANGKVIAKDLKIEELAKILAKELNGKL